MWACSSHSLNRGAAYLDTTTSFVTSCAFNNSSGISQTWVRGLLYMVTPTLMQNEYIYLTLFTTILPPLRARIPPSHISSSSGLFERAVCSCLYVYNRQPIGLSFLVASNLCQAGGFHLKYSRRKLRRTYSILVLSHTASPLHSEHTSSR